VNAHAGAGIYRAMVEESGMPKLGSSATMLGIRKGKDIDVDSADNVHCPAFVAGEKNGLSCAATIASLPSFSLPVEWGGSNHKTAIWKIDIDDVPGNLLACEDSVPGGNRHVSIGPSATMKYNDFIDAIEATRPFWKKVQKN
jgi:hypothetical protein